MCKFAGAVMRQKGSLAITNVTQSPEIKRERVRDGEAFMAMLGAPLKSGAEIIGALVVYCPQARSWTPSDISLVESLAAQASVLVVRVRCGLRAES